MSAGGGYTCSICGMWVAFGQFHGCGATPTYNYPPDPIAVQNATLARIATALERIASALEREDSQAAREKD